ncbi:unnamed protein product [Closterium sp. NIES-53]
MPRPYLCCSYSTPLPSPFHAFLASPHPSVQCTHRPINCCVGGWRGRSTGWKDGIEGLGNCKYLFYMPPARHGVGNRIMALISAFSYALLTNRTLIIPPDSFLFQFFCEPFPGSSWTIPLDAFK